jgi:hypothetical protein
VNINEIFQALRKQVIWEEAQKHVAPKKLGVAFTAFLEERMEWSLNQMQDSGRKHAIPVPSPTGAPKSDDGPEHGEHVENRKIAAPT